MVSRATGSLYFAFQFFGGVPELIIPDNLKAGVRKAHRYEPDLNPTYAEMANHYGTAVMPARVRKPRDKAKVEAVSRGTIVLGYGAKQGSAVGTKLKIQEGRKFLTFATVTKVTQNLSKATASNASKLSKGMDVIVIVQ